MNPFDEYESQKNMAVRRVTNVALIDRMVVYGRSLEARIKTLEARIALKGESDGADDQEYS